MTIVSYEIWPVIERHQPYMPSMIACESVQLEDALKELATSPDASLLWTVYARYENGAADAIGDFETFRKACMGYLSITDQPEDALLIDKPCVLTELAA